MPCIRGPDRETGSGNIDRDSLRCASASGHDEDIGVPAGGPPGRISNPTAVGRKTRVTASSHKQSFFASEDRDQVDSAALPVRKERNLTPLWRKGWKDVVRWILG